MAELEPAPNWMHPLPEAPASLDDAFAACVAAYQDHEAPRNLCRQCIWEEMEARIVAAACLAQAGQTPAPEEFAQIYFEHPNCVGGEDTIKLFLPHGIKTMLTALVPPNFGKHSYPEVIETALRAAFWYWPPDLIAPVREMAARLFYDWFEKGEYVWPNHVGRPGDLLGPGDDIIQLCIICLIDPADLIARLVAYDTPAADDVLCLAGTLSPEAPFYLSSETGADNPIYKPACDQIAASLASREAQATLHHVTPDWLQQAFFKHDGRHSELAAYLSKYENYYDIETVELRKSAALPILADWPELPLV